MTHTSHDLLSTQLAMLDATADYWKTVLRVHGEFIVYAAN